MILSVGDKEHIANTIKDLERKSEAELVAVISQKSGDYGFFWLVCNICITLIVSLFATIFTIYDPMTLLVLQIICLGFFYIFTLLFEKQLISFLPNFYKHKRASIYANKMFDRLGLRKTKSKVGIMFFVCSDEKYVEIVVDEGVKEKIDKVYWEGVVKNFIKSVKSGEFANGYVNAINECSEILIEKFPIRSDDINELPDEVIEI